MKVGNFTPNAKSVLQIEKATQVHQLVTNAKKTAVNAFLNCVLRVWNNHGQIMPPTKLADIAVLNGDEYPLQVGFDFSGNNELIVLTYEICDEGSLNKTVYVELDATGYTYDIELDSIDVLQQTAVRMRNYNLSRIVSPSLLPKNSICIFNYADILSLQKNNDLMGMAEILTHSNCILRDGTLSELHPIVFDSANNSPVPCEAYTEIAKSFIMGYEANPSRGKIIIVTGEDEFLLSPVATGCEVTYCEKSLTIIAQQVRKALIGSGQINNVDKAEFASAVASVGKVAMKENLSTDSTQAVANKVVPLLPSSRIGKMLGIANFNLASEKPSKSGLQKTL